MEDKHWQKKQYTHSLIYFSGVSKTTKKVLLHTWSGRIDKVQKKT